MSIESKWNDFSPELKAEVEQAVHGGRETFIPTPGVRDEAYEHTKDGGIFSSSTLKSPEDADEQDQTSESSVLTLPSDAFVISDKLAEHIRSLPQDNSTYDDGAVLQSEYRSTTIDSPDHFHQSTVNHDPSTFRE